MSPNDERFVIGCLLGDGCITRSYVETWKDNRYYYPRLKITHSIEQKLYLEWKAQNLNRIFGRSTKVVEEEYNSYSGKEGKLPGCRYLFSSKKLECFYDSLYVNGRKTFTKNLYKDLGLQELALFFMDDGSFGVYAEGYERKNKKGENVKYAYAIPRASIATNCMNENELKATQRWIYDLTGCEAQASKVSPNRKDQKVLKIATSDVRRFIETLKPYSHSAIAYKFDLETIKNPASPWVEYIQG